MSGGAKSKGAVALVTGGVASAFGLAACCAIPFLLASIGIGTVAWLAPIVSASQPYSAVLTIFSIGALIGSVAIVWRARTDCRSDSLCARSAFRWTVTGAALFGAVLLALSKIYA